jgi:hypothetical protein
VFVRFIAQGNEGDAIAVRFAAEKATDLASSVILRATVSADDTPTPATPSSPQP